MQIGVFIPIGNNGWLIATTAPQYRPSFDLDRDVTRLAERIGFDVVPVGCVADRHESPHFASLYDMAVKHADVLPADEVAAGLAAMAG